MLAKSSEVNLHTVLCTSDPLFKGGGTVNLLQQNLVTTFFYTKEIYPIDDIMLTCHLLIIPDF